MAFLPPTFNLLCNIYSGPAVVPPFGAPRIANQPCQLRLYKTGPIVNAAGFTSGMYIAILLPAGTDVRGGIGFQTMADLVECPAGSGRYYEVRTFDDVAKGFSNEYRFAIVFQKGYTGGLPVV